MGHDKEAETLLGNTMSKVSEPNFRTLEIDIDFYLKNNDKDGRYIL